MEDEPALDAERMVTRDAPIVAAIDVIFNIKRRSWQPSADHNHSSANSNA